MVWFELEFVVFDERVELELEVVLELLEQEQVFAPRATCLTSDLGF